MANHWSFKCKHLHLVCLFLFLIIGIPPGRAEETMIGNPAFDFLTSEGRNDQIVSNSMEPMVVNPNLTVRLSNPQFNCTTDQYCVDVEFQCDQANMRLLGMNVRFWYDDAINELVNFTGYIPGYGAALPNPPGRTTYSSLGAAWFSFGGAAEYINGAIQLTNPSAAPYISTTGWTKIFQICFLNDDPNANVDSYCPPIPLDLQANPANGGFSGTSGIVMTVLNTAGTALPTDEHVVQYNWQYTGNGTPPYGQPVPITCTSIACESNQSIMVTNTNDTGTGSLRNAIEIANPGDTITFSTSLAGLTINATSGRFIINKNLYIRSNVTPRIKISTNILPGLFDVLAGISVEFKDLDITSGLATTNNDGAAFNNLGTLKLIGVKVFKNPNLPTGQYLVRNKPGSYFNLFGNSFIQFP